MFSSSFNVLVLKLSITLCRFAHTINIEFFTDLVNVFDGLLKSGNLPYRQVLHCVQVVFTILSGQGEALNIDPVHFYGHMYRALLELHAG
jgi:nucleolar complex protein 3